MPQRKRFIDDYLSYLLALASYAVYRDFGREVKAAGLSSLEWRVLASLSDGTGSTVGELAREVLAKQPTLTKLVNRMEAADLVARGDDREDARRTRVAVTPAGRAKVAHLLAAAKRHEARILAPFSKAEVAALKKILRALARADKP
ncbi:MAG: MarR family winged helix-turn-helix transcriptional regulator [Burkholderiales bacterium]